MFLIYWYSKFSAFARPLALIRANRSFIIVANNMELKQLFRALPAVKQAGYAVQYKHKKEALCPNRFTAP